MKSSATLRSGKGNGSLEAPFPSVHAGLAMGTKGDASLAVWLVMSEPLVGLVLSVRGRGATTQLWLLNTLKVLYVYKYEVLITFIL